mmetsp:Transcript_1179/g.1271  ORF Transcript_1179/g.1271 Transcript_1179/m.1271 type:complete len:80 (-) Transcript_1179:184-423(-)
MIFCFLLFPSHPPKQSRDPLSKSKEEEIKRRRKIQVILETTLYQQRRHAILNTDPILIQFSTVREIGNCTHRQNQSIWT